MRRRNPAGRQILKQPWLEQRERSNDPTLRFLVWLSLRLGRPVGRMLLYPICLYFFLFSVKGHAASRQYLSKVFGRAPRLTEVFRHYYCFATVALDRMFLLRHRFAQFDVRVHGKDVLEEARILGEPYFLLGAHLGSFEALHVFGLQHNMNVTMMMFEEGSRNINALAKAISPELHRSVIGMGALDSMMKVQERLALGEWVGMLGDRRIYESGAVRVPFFGSTAALPTAPFRIAALIGRPVVLMVALYRGGNRYDLHFERLVETVKLERSQRDAKISQWASLYAQRLEYYCRLAPYNWFNFYDFWADSGERS